MKEIFNKKVNFNNKNFSITII